MLALSGLVHVALALIAAPLLLSIIHRTKAVFAGRRGQPWLQPYRELGKLLGTAAVYSHTATPVFLLGPLVSCAAVVLALFFLPLGGVPAVVAFPGDFVLVAYLLGLARFCTVVSALDTGSSFEGMGASREVCFSALAAFLRIRARRSSCTFCTRHACLRESLRLAIGCVITFSGTCRNSRLDRRQRR